MPVEHTYTETENLTIKQTTRILAALFYYCSFVLINVAPKWTRKCFLYHILKIQEWFIGRFTPKRTWLFVICLKSRTDFFEIITGNLLTNVCKLLWFFCWSCTYYLIVFILNFYLKIEAKKARVTVLLWTYKFFRFCGLRGRETSRVRYMEPHEAHELVKKSTVACEGADILHTNRKR